MKAILYIVFALSYCNAIGQNCNDYIHFKKGASFEMETYDPKGVKTNRIESTVTEVNTGDKATLHIVTYDKSNVKDSEGDFKAICMADKILFDISNLLKSDKLGVADNNMDVKIESGYLEIPKSLSIGQTLPSNVITITMTEKKSGDIFGITKVTIQDKKVESRETITTPAGSFVCHKITYNSKIEAKLAMNDLAIPALISPGVYYISKEVGLVKSVNLGQKKEVKSYTLLTKVKK